MIDHLELKELPYVDGTPDITQKRLGWVLNGDEITGATTKYGSDGVLNRPSVGIQKNVEQLFENSETSKATINTLIDNVNNINEALEASVDVSVITQISTNKGNIEILQSDIAKVELDITGLKVETTTFKSQIGTYNPVEDTVYRPIRDDLLFIKKEMGQYPNQNINGIPEAGAAATGMKRRIIDNSSAIVSQAARIKKLEDDYSDSDVGTLNKTVNEIREELGPRTESIGKSPVYTRLSDLETSSKTNLDSITAIKKAIDFDNTSSLSSRVLTNETNIASLSNSINSPNKGILFRVETLENTIGSSSDPNSVNGKLYILNNEYAELSTIVGKDSSSGLRGEVTWLTQTIGPSTNPGADTIQGKLSAVTNLSNENASTLQDIQIEIGTNTSGLKGNVLTLGRQMNGTIGQDGITIEERGIMLSVKDLDTKTSDMIHEAPKDGKAYVRKDGAWVDLDTYLNP